MSKNAVFRGKRHDNKILNCKFYCREILLSLRRLLVSKRARRHIRYVSKPVPPCHGTPVMIILIEEARPVVRCYRYSYRAMWPPKESFRKSLNLLPCKARITLRGKNNLGNVNVMLVFKGIFGGSLKITLLNRNNPKG